MDICRVYAYNMHVHWRETIFTTPTDMQLHLFEVANGSRYGRRKWHLTFNDTDCVIFTVDIASYDQVISEDKSVGRIVEDLTLFGALVNSPWFTHAHFILIFTKMDKLQARLQKSPIGNYFADFEGDETSVEDVKTYIEKRFLDLDKREVKPEIPVLYTTIVDEDNPLGQIIVDTITKEISFKKAQA